MTDIVSRFDPEDIDDLLAYEKLLERGTFPDHYTDGVTFPPHWQAELAMKIASHFVKVELADLRVIGYLI